MDKELAEKFGLIVDAGGKVTVPEPDIAAYLDNLDQEGFDAEMDEALEDMLKNLDIEVEEKKEQKK